MSDYFCGNPNNHESHEKEGRHCEGIHRPVVDKDPVIFEEKWEPIPAIPAPPEGEHSTDWVSGWADGFKLQKRTYANITLINDYNAGYHASLEYQMRAGNVAPNTIRAAMGLPEFDPVKIVEHYNPGKSEVANFISDNGLDFNRGNVVKYVSRAGKKDKKAELQDLEKAAAYLQMAYNVAQGKPSVIRDPETNEVVWSLFRN